MRLLKLGRWVQGHRTAERALYKAEYKRREFSAIASANIVGALDLSTVADELIIMGVS